MKYFIDFEAIATTTNEIISVGIVREDGNKFYALVAPKDVKKVTPFITDLTGITREMLSTACSAEDVFGSLYSWIFDQDTDPEFYCWGNEDTTFIHNTFIRIQNCQKAKFLLGYMAGSMRDFAQTFCSKACIKSCSLINAYNALMELHEIQAHNALDDAEMLWHVYAINELLHKDELVTMLEICPKIQKAIVKKEKTPKLQTRVPTKKEKLDVPLTCGRVAVIDETNTKVIQSFDSFFAAAKWLRMQNPNTPKDMNTVAGSIRKSCCTFNKFMKKKWRVVV